MSESAMSSTIWDGEWALHSCNLDDWLFFKDELNSKEVNDPSLKLTKHEIAEQVLQDIEDLGRSNKDGWLDDFALFDELQSVIPIEELEPEKKFENNSIKLEEEQPSPNDGSIVPEGHKQPSVNQDLFSVSYENTATFLLSNENIIYINNQPYVSLTPMQSEQMEIIHANGEEPEKKQKKENPEDASIQPALNTLDVKTEMAVVDEIIRSTALELDQWESDTSRSETSSDGTSASDLSPKEEEEFEEAAEETDDPDWKPDALKINGRMCMKKLKPYRRCGSQEEKTLRKKEQNRHAATRYRQKKKAEANEILKDEEMLKKRKSELEEKVVDIQREIKCLKELMRDLFKAKGIIN